MASPRLRKRRRGEGETIQRRPGHIFSSLAHRDYRFLLAGNLTTSLVATLGTAAVAFFEKALALAPRPVVGTPGGSPIE